MSTLRRITTGVGGALATLLVGTFLIGYAAPFLSPSSFWWADLFAAGLPLMSVGITVLAVGLCGWGGYRRRWGRVVVGVGLLLLIVVRFGPRLAAWGPSVPDQDALRVMTFNVPPMLGDAGNDRTPLVTLVGREAPDVLALQESRLRTTAGRQGEKQVSASIRPLLGSSLGYAPPKRLPSSTVIQQPVIGRLTLDSTTVHPLPPDGETRARSRYTRTTFRWQGHPVVLYNVHLHTIGRARPWTLVPEKWTSFSRWKTFLHTYREGALRRAQQARLIRRRVQRETHPVLVVGDFNSTPHQWAYWHLAQGLQNAAARRVRGWAATFPAQRPIVQIDHVLASPAWQVTAARIPANGAAGISDHRPVVAYLTWKPRQP